MAELSAVDNQWSDQNVEHNICDTGDQLNENMSNNVSEPDEQILEEMSTVSDDLNDPFDIEQYFDSLDKNNDGFLDYNEITLALECSCIPSNPAVVTKIFRELDTNNDGLISVEEFKNFSREKNKSLRSMFDSFDYTRTGSINTTDVRIALEKLGCETDDFSVNSLIKQMDVDGDGVVSYEEFTKFYHLIPMETVKSMFVFFERDAAIDIGESATTVDRRPGSSPWSKLVAGGFAGGFSRTFTAPLDLVKVVMQAQTQGKALTLKEGMQNVYADGGFRAFFRGNGANILRIAPETSCKFLVYDKMKDLISRDIKHPAILERLACGGVAGAISQTLVYPLQITKTRLNIAPTGTYNGIFDTMRHIVRKEGTMALFKGLGASSMGIIPYASVDLALYNALKEEYCERYSTDPSVMTLLACGSVSSISGQIVSYPFQRIRTLLQVQGMAGREAEFNGTLDCAVKTVRSAGVVGLYRGMLPNMLKSVPAIAISYATYEKMKIALDAFRIPTTMHLSTSPVVK